MANANNDDDDDDDDNNNNNNNNNNADKFWKKPGCYLFWMMTNFSKMWSMILKFQKSVKEKFDTLPSQSRFSMDVRFYFSP